jgi:hypothetical protein
MRRICALYLCHCVARQTHALLIVSTTRAKQSLEYLWQQGWMQQEGVTAAQVSHFSHDGEAIQSPYNGLFTHTFAYKLYDIPNTCGPSWDICATFDFERPVSQIITPQNVRYVKVLHDWRWMIKYANAATVIRECALTSQAWWFQPIAASGHKIC